MDIIRNSIFYILSILLGVVTVTGFMTSIPVGLLSLAATILCLPVVQELIRKLTGKKMGKGLLALICLLLAALLMAGALALADEQSIEENAEGNEVTTIETDADADTENADTEGTAENVDTEGAAEDAENGDTEGTVEDAENADTEGSDTDSGNADTDGSGTNSEDTDTDSENGNEDSQTSADAATNETLSTNGNSATEPSKLEVHFIDVGQGDATLLKCGGNAMLIDTGDDSKGTAVWNYLRKQGVEALDYLLLTHPHSDHIGGAPVILTKLDIREVFASNFVEDTSAYQKLMRGLEDQQLKATTPPVGSSYSLGDAKFTILAPGFYFDNPNDSSIALMVEHGENRFLFTGDAEVQGETGIMASGQNLDADVYQVGHHGSSTASSVNLLNAVTPEYAVISCAEGNSYGHPHAETLNNMRTMGIKLFRTDEQGSIIATSDREEITWNCAPTETWQAGERTQSADSSADNKKPEEGYVLNTNTQKIHLPDCDSVKEISDDNKQTSKKTKEELMEEGYSACNNCNP